MKKFKITCETKKAYKQVMKSLDNLQEMFEDGVYIGRGEKDNPDKDYKLKYKQEEKMYPIIVKANFKYVSDLRTLIRNDLLSREKDVTFAICEDSPVPEYVLDEPDYPEHEECSDYDEDYEQDAAYDSVDDSTIEEEDDYESTEEEHDIDETEPEDIEEELPEWQKRIARKLENGESLSNVELKEMVWNLPKVAEDSDIPDARRGLQGMETVVALGRKLYRIIWEQGYDNGHDWIEDVFENQPQEVDPYPVKEIVQNTYYLTAEERAGYELDENQSWADESEEEEELDL